MTPEPPPIKAEINKAMEDSDAKVKSEALGMESDLNSFAEFGKFLRNELDK